MKKTRHAIAFSLATAALAVGGCDAAPPTESPRPDPSAAAGSALPTPGAPLTYDSLVALLAEKDDFAKARKLGELLPALGPESLPAVKEALEEAAVLEMNAVEFELLMRYWTMHEPKEAAYYALGKAPRAYNVAAIYGAVLPWVEADPEQALPTLRPYTRAQGDAGAAAQIALVRGWYGSGHPGLEDYIRGIGAGFERQRALSAFATCIIRDKGVEAAVKWAESIPDSTAEYKLEAFRKMGTALVPYDVEAAKRFCEAHCEGPFGSNLRVRIAERWARDDAASSLTWLADAPESQDTHLAVRIAYAVWGTRDGEAAIRWMKEQIARHATGEPPRWLEPTLPIHARLLAEDSPVAGLDQAARLKDPHERNVVMVELAHKWYHGQDRAAAEAWLSKSPLNEALRAMVRSPEQPAVKGGEGETAGAHG